MVGRLKIRECPKPFSLMDMFPGKDEADTAEYVVDFFTSIADQFQPLTEEDIPPNCEIATAFRSVRKRSKKE